MSHRLWQLWRGTLAQVLGVTPSDGEPIWDNVTKRLRIGDGSTAGGLRVVMKADKDVADYGLSFEGVVTEATDTTHFKVSTLAGFGAEYFKPTAGAPYEIFVVQADNAAPEGEQTPVVAYTTSDGTFEHSAFTQQLAVGDIVLIIHPLLASLGTKATGAATGAVSTAKFMMAYQKQVVTLLRDGAYGLSNLKALIDAIQTDVGDPTGETLASISAKIGNIARSLDVIIGARWDSSGDLGTDIAQLLTYTDILDDGTNGLVAIKNLLNDIAGYITTEIADILTDTGTTLPALLTTIDTVVDGIQTDLDNATDGLGALKTLLDAIITDIASAVPEPPTAKSLQDILHKDNTFTWVKSTDALQAISDDIDQQHLNIHILFIIPEAVGSITADNTALLTELQKVGDVHTITQGDALEFPAFGSYAVAVLGSSSGTAWTESNLVDLKNILGLTLICVDKACAAYFEIGTDGGDATAKTVIRAISEIEGTKMGEGDANHQSVTGIDAGNNTVTTSATYHTLNMADGNITETVFCTEANDPDDVTAKEDVVLGIIRRIQNDGSIGVDEAGADIPATLGFAGFAYEGNKLTTLGKALFLLFCHMLIQLRIQEQSVETGGLVADLRKRIFGNMKGSFTNTAPLVEYIAGQDNVGGKLPDGVSLADLLTTSDWKGSFNWDTAGYTTVEQDISALFSPNLAIATRRKYSVKLDLTNIEADGSFVSLYLAVKEKVDGTNYRAIDRKTVLKADIAATAEPGIIIDIPATSENVQITLQMSVALGADATIYYAVVKEHLE